MPPQPLYTATEIGRSIGQSRFAVRRKLARTPPTARVMSNGNPADAWCLAALPPELRDAFARGPVKGWEPPICLAELHPDCITYATRLRAAFSLTFAARWRDDATSAAELATLGVIDYRKTFGHGISSRQWQRLLERITERDGGVENWTRLEIYLPDEKHLRRPQQPPREAPADFAPLAEEYSLWADPLKPNAAEEKALYLAAFDWLEAAIAGGCTEAEAKRPLIAWLKTHAGLSTSEDTMRRVFNKKLAAWRERGAEALEDGRKAANAAKRAPQLPEVDEKLLVEHAATKCDGFIATAWRECYHRLSINTQNRYSKFQDGARRKDYVPRAIVKMVAPKVKLAMIMHQGEKQARMRGPFISRDWSDIYAGDNYSTDDATLEVYAAVVQADGAFKVIRGQSFPWVDERSKLVFGFSLLAKEQFNAHDILSGLYDAFESNGVCRKLLRTENGIFRKANCLGRGQQNDLFSEHRQRITDKLGIRWSFTKPRNPRGKIVENILRLIIRRLPAQNMFVGRLERETSREDVQWAIREVNSGRKHPHEVGMLLFDEWEEELAKVMAAYNEEPQESRIYQGVMSPLEAWERFQLRNQAGEPVPLAPFPRELRLLLTPARISTVKGFGIAVKINGTPWPSYFDSPELSPRRYQTVLIRVDPGNPSEILVTDMRGENPLLVPQVRDTPADATPEEMRAAAIDVAARSAYGRTYYRSLRPNNHPGFPPVMLDAAARNTLSEIETQRRQIQSVRRVESARRGAGTTRMNRAMEDLKDFLNS